MLKAPKHMRNVTHFMMAVAVASLVGACGEINNPPATGSSAQNITLDGCVAPGMRPDGDFILRDVIRPDAAAEPGGQDDVHGPLVTDGSWVRLVGSKDANLNDYLGKRVEITGSIIDSGVNTLGTSGHAGTDEDKYKRSTGDAGTNPVRNMTPTTTAPNGGDANGTAPRLAVEHIKAISDSCEGGK